MTKGDKYLIIFIALASVFMLFLVGVRDGGYSEKYVSVQVNGEEVKKVYLGRAVLDKTIAIESDFGYNLLEFKEDSVRVIEADCPDELDVKKGWIDKVGETIVCLPNRMVVEIKGKKGESDLDYISR